MPFLLFIRFRSGSSLFQRHVFRWPSLAPSPYSCLYGIPPSLFFPPLVSIFSVVLCSRESYLVILK